MTDKPENPPAFPFKPEYNDNGASQVYEGMTLRDYFAAHCPMTIVEFGHGLEAIGHEDASADQMLTAFARIRYNYADAMLKAREAK